MRKVALLLLCGLAACVEVPRAIRNDFAEPRAHERSNFRHGPHGAPPEVEVVDAGEDAGAEAAPDASSDDDGDAR